MIRFWKKYVDPDGLDPFIDEDFLTLSYAPEIGSLSDSGRVRSNNQDNIGIINFPDKKNLLAVVADGMGGHQGGEIASRMAVEVIQKNFSKLLARHNGAQALKRVFLDANEAIFRYAQQLPHLMGMGTTLVAMVLLKGRIFYANTGDSRLYQFRSGQSIQLSQDHTLVNEMVRTGLLEPEAAANHPDKHVITRAIGTHSQVQVDVSESPLEFEIGDCFLLCSDGLHDLVTESEMLDLISDNTSQQACNRLVELANSRGGYDNISVIIIKILAITGTPADVPATKF